jgi:signal transduction histidine kinase
VDVRCDAHGSTVTVRDDGAGLAPRWQDGTGLSNCRERLRHHGDGRGTLEIRALERGTEAVLRLTQEAGR